MPSRAISSICAGLPPPGQTTATSGCKATSRSMSTAVTSPMRGTRCAADGWSEYWTVAMTCAPAPAANSISVAPGARLTIRRGGLTTVTRWPVSSEIVMRMASLDAATAAAKSAAAATAVSIEATTQSTGKRPQLIVMYELPVIDTVSDPCYGSDHELHRRTPPGRKGAPARRHPRRRRGRGGERRLGGADHGPGGPQGAAVTRAAVRLFQGQAGAHVRGLRAGAHHAQAALRRSRGAQPPGARSDGGYRACLHRVLPGVSRVFRCDCPLRAALAGSHQPAAERAGLAPGRSGHMAADGGGARDRRARRLHSRRCRRAESGGHGVVGVYSRDPPARVHQGAPVGCGWA